MKKLAIIGSEGIPASFGGFETLAENLVRELANKYEITVYCSSKMVTSGERPSTYSGAKLKYIHWKANGAQNVIYHYISIVRAIFSADILLILGVSGCTLLPLVRLFSRKKIIVNIDGLEWRRKKWSKFARWFLRLSERVAIRYSHADVTDNDTIRRYTALYYGTISHVIAYGGDHAKITYKKRDLIKKYPFTQGPYFVKVARIEPENNIELILEAFSDLKETIALIGNWSDSSYSRELKSKYGNYPNIHLLDPIYYQKEVDFLRSSARGYIHGHEAGGDNPSLVEAMSLALPVLAFNVSFNQETTKFSALYFSTVEQLRNLIQDCTFHEFEQNRLAMKEIANENYRWELISEQYENLIELVLVGMRKRKVKLTPDKIERMKLFSNEFEHLINTKFF